MRAVVPLAAALLLAMPGAGVAQQRAPKGTEATRTRESATAAKPAVSQTEKDAAEARSRSDARERAWDDRMKRTMRSICSGVTGC